MGFFSMHSTITGLKNIVRYAGTFLKQGLLYRGSAVLMEWSTLRPPSHGPS